MSKSISNIICYLQLDVLDVLHGESEGLKKWQFSLFNSLIKNVKVDWLACQTRGIKFPPKF